MDIKLVEAVRAGNLDSAKNLLGEGSCVNAKDSETGLTVLMIAAGLGNVSMVHLLLAAGAEVNILSEKMGQSALHKASQKGDIEVARLLLEHGALLDIQAPTYGHTPLLDAIWYKNIAMTKYLLDLGANLNIHIRYGLNLQQFLEATLKVNEPGREKLMKIYQLLDDRRRSYEKTIRSQKLTRAARNNDSKAVKQLISSGADLDAQYPVISSHDDGYTPLLVASRDNYPEIAKELLKAGADGQTEDATFKEQPAHKAARMGNPEIVEILIESGKIDINVQGPMNGYTPLHDALWHGNTETATIFINAGARLDIKTHDGKTPLDIAIEVFGIDSEIVELIESKSNLDVKIEPPTR